MLLDLFSPSNNVTYNIKLAQIIGLHPAIYLSQLLDINKKAIKKGTLEDNYLVIDRKYITDRTTLDEAEQDKIDQKFIEIGLIEKKNSNSIIIDLSRLLSILCCEDDFVIEDLNKIFKKTTKRVSKQEAIVENLKQNIETTNEELRAAYCDWIDAVYSKQNWMSKKAVQLGQEIVDKFSNHDLDIALKVIDIATVNGYRDMNWAVENYKKNFKVKYTYTNVPEFLTAQPVKRDSLSSEVF